MSIEGAFYTYAIADSGLQALLPVGDSPATYKVYQNIAPEGTEADYAVFGRIGAQRPPHFSGAATIENAVLQVDCYSETPEGARAICDAFIAAFDGLQTTVTVDSVPHRIKVQHLDDRGFYDHAAGLHRVVVDFSIWNK